MENKFTKRNGFIQYTKNKVYGLQIVFMEPKCPTTFCKRSPNNKPF